MHSPPDQHSSTGAFSHEFVVGETTIDENGHVNNVVYVQWMQDVAILHSADCGGTAATHALGCSWIVRNHQIDYLAPAFAGEGVIAITWVVDFRKVRSLRKYAFLRKRDNKVLARGQTEWVFVDQSSGRPRPIPREVSCLYPLLPDYRP